MTKERGAWPKFKVVDVAWADVALKCWTQSARHFTGVTNNQTSALAGAGTGFGSHEIQLAAAGVVEPVTQNTLRIRSGRDRVRRLRQGMMPLSCQRQSGGTP